MSQFGRHMSLHGHFCGPNWCHLGPVFLPPPSFFLRGMGGCVTIFRCCINACIGRQHGPKMTQHGSHIGTQHYHIGVFWSILHHLEATLAKYGAQLGSILVHLGPFWTQWDVLGIKIHIFWMRLMRIWHFGTFWSIVPLMFRNTSSNTQTTRTLSFAIPEFVVCHQTLIKWIA